MTVPGGQDVIQGIASHDIEIRDALLGSIAAIYGKARAFAKFGPLQPDPLLHHPA